MKKFLNNFYAHGSWKGEKGKYKTTGRKSLKGHVWSQIFIIFQHKVIKGKTIKICLKKGLIKFLGK